MDRKKSHRRILEDLNNIRNKAEEVWNKIGEWSLHEKTLLVLQKVAVITELIITLAKRIINQSKLV